MQKIMEFNGHKTVSVLEKEDYQRVEELMFDDDFREICLLKKSDFSRAVREGLKIYSKEFHTEYGGTVEHFFIRISRDALFKYAER
jgi:hypothetical protein